MILLMDTKLIFDKFPVVTNSPIRGDQVCVDVLRWSQKIGQGFKVYSTG